VTGICSLCGHVGPVHLHHLTGRSERGARYLDSELTIALCPKCHTGASGVHPTLRACKLDFPASGADLLAYRLRRVGFHAELLGGAGRAFVVEPSAARALAALLFDGADALADKHRSAA
jgi:hypothetical protein